MIISISKSEIKKISYHKRYLRFHFFALSLIILMLPACGSHIYHVVESGETLYSIGWMYGHDYRQLANWNNIDPPYIINRGQRLQLVPPSSTSSSRTSRTRNSRRDTQQGVKQASQNQSLTSVAVKDSRSSADNASVADHKPRVLSGKSDSSKRVNKLEWTWPTKGGKVVQTYRAGDPSRKGLDVAGRTGQPVYSAAAGRVVYSGSGLGRYGKLIIVKHNEQFLSAYAHNRRLLVKEGDQLLDGQMIAEMGSTGTHRTKLHFEIRRNGKPVDPLRYLPNKTP